MRKPLIILMQNGFILLNVMFVKPSLSMKILSINNFTTKLLSKLLSDLYIGVHLKGTKSLVVKLSIDNFFIERLFFIWKYCLLLTLLPNFLVSKTTFPIERSLRSVLRSLIVKLLIDNIFIERLCHTVGQDRQKCKETLIRLAL